MTDLLSLGLPELENYIIGLGEPKFRAKQVFGWLMRGKSIDEMNNVPKALREKLKADAFVSSVTLREKKVSSDGTQKFLFSLYDGECIESVLMKYERGYTVCISTEAGCAMGCKFCASTLGGLSRRLLPGEMLSQVIYAQNEAGEKLSGIVLMGIGEPLDNYDNVLKFLRLVGSEDGLNIGYRHISLSTCGLVDKIYRLAEEELPITLSISLHASDNETRSSLMPINRKWCIEELLTACHDYFAKTGRRISFEYTLAAGKNDTEKDARSLSAILKKFCPDMPLHVNLIPVNATGRGFSPSDRENIRRFAEVLTKNHIVATVRRHLGGDIDASCGQLRAKAKTENF